MLKLIHKEGHIWTIGSLVIFIFLLALCAGVYFWLMFIVGGVLLFLIFNFFRNPPRPIPTIDNHLVYAPADGKVVVIEEVEETEFFKDRRKMVSIFMNPLNVHVNRYPFGGKVIYTKYHPGLYLVAWHPKSSTDNERNTVVIERQDGVRIMMRQIAGALARRICCYSKPGQPCTQGDDFGFIKFGSRVDLYLPLNAEINVQLEQLVFGNTHVIARIP